MRIDEVNAEISREGMRGSVRGALTFESGPDLLDADLEIVCDPELIRPVLVGHRLTIADTIAQRFRFYLLRGRSGR